MVEEVRIMKHATGSWHMWLLAAGAVAALLLGWGLGLALALAVVGCGAMLATVFWIGRSSARQISIDSHDPTEVKEQT